MAEFVMQRRFPRFPLKLPVLYKVLEPAPGKPGVGWTRDLSEGGACLELAERLEQSTVLSVLFRSDLGGLELTAKVAWVGKPGPGQGGIAHGVAFEKVGPNQQEALRQLLAEHKVQLRHQGVRVPLEVSIRCQVKGGTGQIVEGRTGDISRSGMLLHLPVTVPSPTVLKVSIPTARGTVEAEGEIAWVEPLEARIPGESIRHGFRFTEISWPNQLTLGLLLAGAP
jgi:c-di-GMP-binding flagellar brake protein YcgR